MSLYDQTIPVFRQMLTNLASWLDEAAAYAKEREFDPATLLASRLYPDQFDLTRQIQTACDTAKLTGARLAGVDAPKHEDGPATLDQLKARIAEVREFLGGLDRSAVDAAADRRFAPPFLGGREVRFTSYVREFGIPNFYFHVTTAYAILRHNGVKLGKRTFIGHMTLED